MPSFAVTCPSPVLFAQCICLLSWRLSYILLIDADRDVFLNHQHICLPICIVQVKHFDNPICHITWTDQCLVKIASFVAWIHFHMSHLRFDLLSTPILRTSLPNLCLTGLALGLPGDFKKNSCTVFCQRFWIHWYRQNLNNGVWKTFYMILFLKTGNLFSS